MRADDVKSSALFVLEQWTQWMDDKPIAPDEQNFTAVVCPNCNGYINA